MARFLTSTKQANVEAGATRPAYLVEWQHGSSTEYLSCSGDITYDGQLYTEGGLTITSLEDGKTATIVLPATAARVTEIQDSTWRLGVCKITAILASPGDSPTYAASDGDLMLDGVIEQSSFSGETISVTAKCKYYRGALVPRFTFDDVITTVPPVGSTSTWEGENYSYEQWLKTTAAIQHLVRPGVNPQVTGRLSTTQVNSVVPVEQSGYKLLTAQGVNIPIVYGRATVPGFIFADGEHGGSKFIGVAWCLGEVYSVEKVFINDEEVPATVTAKHYRGTTTQTVSPALQLYTSMSPEFSDDLILRTPAGNIGIAYSVFNIPASAISGAPRFRAIIQGRMVADPSSTATDPYADSVEWSFNFLEGVTDSGPNAYTLTLNGDAGISSPSVGLELDGTGDYATIPNGTAISAKPFSLEIEFIAATVASSPGTTETLLCHGSTASPLSRSVQIDRVGDELLLYLSSDGSTWDICDGLSCGTLAGGSPDTIGRLLVERVDDQISTYMDGATQTGTVSTAALYDSGEAWEVGACGGAQEFSGIIRSARLTIGVYRYGSPHAITNTPFSDSGNYTAGVVYSEKPALAWNDIATNSVFGLGGTTTGVEEAVAYGDTAMESGAPRCRIGLAITEPRQVETWLDQLAMYANSLWFPEGANLKIVPDKKKDGSNGSGPELYTATSPEFGSPLPTVTTEDGVSYSVSIEITAESTTSPLTGVSVNFGGTTIITSVTSMGVHGALVTASGTSNTIEVVEDGSFNGTWANLSVKRTHRAITQWLPSTLRLQGTPEGDKPNAVLAKYNVPDELSGAWSQKTFGVMNAAAADGDPIVLTTLDLQGVNRIEEASNKAIATLYRNDKKTIVSLISTDEEVVCQPGDTVQVVGAQRGVDTPVFVESNRMVSYGRHQITGTIYRDNQYPDKDYTDYSEGGRLDEDGYIEESIGIRDITCTNMVPTSSTGTLVSIWEGASVNTSVSGYIASLISTDGLIAVNGSTIFQVEQDETNFTTGNTLNISNDLGDSWTECSLPFDDVFDAQAATYDTDIQPNSCFRSIRFIGSSLYVQFMQDSGGRDASTFSTTDGATWTLEVGATSTNNDASNSWGNWATWTYQSYYIAASEGELLVGGRASGFDYRVGYMVGPWSNATTGFSEVVNPDNHIQYGGSSSTYQQSACYHIADVGGRVYQSGNGPSFIWAGVQGTRAISSIYWGSFSWDKSQTGSWYAADNVNSDIITGLDVSQSGWQHDSTSLLLPKTNKDTAGDANEGTYTHITGTTDTDIDYSSLLVKGDAPNEGDLWAFGVYFVPGANKWVMLYAFEATVGIYPSYFYMRVGGTGHSPASFGPAKKVNMPSGQKLRVGENAGGPFALDYSSTGGAWVFSTFILEGATYKQLTATLSDDFACP